MTDVRQRSAPLQAGSDLATTTRYKCRPFAGDLIGRLDTDISLSQIQSASSDTQREHLLTLASR